MNINIWKKYYLGKHCSLLHKPWFRRWSHTCFLTIAIFHCLILYLLTYHLWVKQFWFQMRSYVLWCRIRFNIVYKGHLRFFVFVQKTMDNYRSTIQKWKCQKYTLKPIYICCGSYWDQHQYKGAQQTSIVAHPRFARETFSRFSCSHLLDSSEYRDGFIRIVRFMS